MRVLSATAGLLIALFPAAIVMGEEASPYVVGTWEFKQGTVDTDYAFFSNDGTKSRHCWINPRSTTGFLRQTKGSLKPKIPFYVGGEECFCSREWTAPPTQGNFGALDRRALEEADVNVTFAEGPAIVADHAFTSGQVPLTTYEKVLSPTKMRIGLVDGVGCYPDQFTEEERRQAIIPDQFRHEIATIFNLKGRGLVVLTSCSHRGVVNIVKQPQKVSGVRKVHAVMGGFHLAPFKDDYVEEVVASLKEIDPDYIIPMHCTGEPFWDIAKQELSHLRCDRLLNGCLEHHAKLLGEVARQSLFDKIRNGFRLSPAFEFGDADDLRFQCRADAAGNLKGLACFRSVVFRADIRRRGGCVL
jgi:metal-dependent hydrolase (beta-lactamase superfamily II)